MSKPHIITVCQRKGGVGKTTSCLNLAGVFGQMGIKTLLIDLDDQMNVTNSVLSHETGKKSIADLLTDNADAEEVCRETMTPNVSLIPSTPSLSGVVKSLNEEPGGHLLLKEKLEHLQQFAIVLIDTSPSLNILVMNALCASTDLFIPVNTKYFSFEGLKQTLDTYRKVKGRLNRELYLAGIGIVNHDRRNILASQIAEELYQTYPDYLLKTIIGINIAIEEAQVHKEPIVLYSPEDRGSRQYKELGKELLDRMGVLYE